MLCCDVLCCGVLWCAVHVTSTQLTAVRHILLSACQYKGEPPISPCCQLQYPVPQVQRNAQHLHSWTETWQCSFHVSTHLQEDKTHQEEVAQRPALIRQCSLSSTSPQSRWCRSTGAWGPLVDGIHSGEGEGWGREQLGGGHTAAPAEDLA